MSQAAPDRKAFVARKKALLDADISQALVAREAQVSHTLVHQVLTGARKSPRVLAVLVARLGEAVVKQLWPSVDTTQPTQPEQQTAVH